MSAPCKDCPDRVVGCHSKCEKYISFRKQRDEMLAKKAEVNKQNNDVWDSIMKRKNKKRW